MVTNLRKIREERGLSQTELAEGVQISQTAIARYESGEQNPRVEVLIRLANFLHVRTDELLGQPEDGQVSIL